MVDLENNGQYLNFSGCGNTLNCNHPVVRELILDSLRHWAVEYHIDGFRFDLASVLCRGTDGSPLNAPPFVRAVAKDNILSRCKIIAEPWDCGGLYLVGSFPNWVRWAEWNGKYRDDFRRFIKGDAGTKSSFATRLAGSADLYRSKKKCTVQASTKEIIPGSITSYSGFQTFRQTCKRKRSSLYDGMSLLASAITEIGDFLRKGFVCSH